MELLSALLGLLLGLVAVFCALRARRHLVARLGRPWLMRFVGVQAGLINIVLFVVVRMVAGNLGWNQGAALWIVAMVYGLVFFGYSLSNIEWTARKFHGVED